MNQERISFALEVEHISKIFKKGKTVVKALEDVSFKVKKGQIYGVLGPNGSGKSTLIRIISTLLIPDTGKVKVFGFDAIKDHLKVREFINRVSAEASFFKKLSAIENLLFVAGIYGISRKVAKQRIYEIAQKLALDIKRLNEPLEDFSRGMQQKVALIRAFLTQPRLLLLDEPTTGLDPRAKLEVQKFIINLRKAGTTILLTTHDMVEAEKLCDEVAIIYKGKIVASGKPQELKDIAANHKKNITLEDVFLYFTGYKFEEVEMEEAIN
ncbi:MAG: type transport system ATP-binding protein [Thermotogaceae bacterium]|jgi:ABC-2 type transport system ATP-binding protein|nr:type transport system ATP-binding protein [Thermotogaceae bacterium]MDN5337299.1 type transport system ATP-binding protein [Thermotogaceae bacterium]